jgi:hypothetical protein
MNPTKEPGPFDRELAVITELAREAGAILLAHYHSPFLVEQKVNALKDSKSYGSGSRSK